MFWHLGHRGYALVPRCPLTSTSAWKVWFVRGLRGQTPLPCPGRGEHCFSRPRPSLAALHDFLCRVLKEFKVPFISLLASLTVATSRKKKWLKIAWRCILTTLRNCFGDGCLGLWISCNWLAPRDLPASPPHWPLLTGWVSQWHNWPKADGFDCAMSFAAVLGFWVRRFSASWLV